eukprot:gene39978-54056_t
MAAEERRVSERDNFDDIRAAVRRLCADFPGSYWQALDRDRIYPTDFVQTLTREGWLSVLIPEEFGGAGLGLGAANAILEEIHRSGCNGGACHAQMYVMGTLLKHGSAAQKQAYLPRIASGELRLQAFGVTEPTSGTDTTRIRTFARRDGDDYIVSGQKIWISRAEHSDLMVLLARPRRLDHRGTTVVVFDSNGTAVINGAAPGPYTIDQAAKKICGDAGGQQLCVTFGEMGTEVGFSTTYTDTAGNSGTATITAVSN